MLAVYFVVALLAGALVTLQTGSNARLKEALGQAFPAVVVSSLIGIVLLVAIIVGTRTPVPPLARVTAAPWTAWLGGALGAAYAVTVVSPSSGSSDRGIAHESHRDAVGEVEDQLARFLGRRLAQW
jgi:uncharacterized membrane protein YdcZ (DUF606 family)